LTSDLYLLGDSSPQSAILTVENALVHFGGGRSSQASSEDHYLQVNVQDTGIGIAPEHLRHVFDRFWRADVSPGLGWRLWIRGSRSLKPLLKTMAD